MFLKPKKGLRVINPETKKPISEEGEEIALSTYWRKRIAEGDFELPENIKKEEVVIPQKTNENKQKTKIKNEGGLE